MGAREVADVDGRTIELSNLDKVLFPSTGMTKGEVIAYYAEVADTMLPYCAGRPATRKRWPDGVGTAEKPRQAFFEKDVRSPPPWVRVASIDHSSRTVEYPLVNDRATLVWLAQLAALEIHVPQWRFGKGGKRLPPDRLVLDLDPGEGAGLPECIHVAKAARTLLADVGLHAIPVLSGSKGIHLYAALNGVDTTDAASAFAKEVARALESQDPDLVVSDMKKSLRAGKVLVDWSQNNGSKTTVAPYSLRGRPDPAVAAPVTWAELSRRKRHLRPDEVLKRVRDGKEPLADALPSSSDALSEYRRKRHADRTREPIPDAVDGSADGNTFVIQEHHALRLHWDFRLERDGVLVSWALPKGVPTDPKRNHLAVHVEDHPIEYGSFEGEIAKGEYGAGTVSIWDHGTYDLEKWRDGEEVICTLHGQKNGGLRGDRKFALIHTGKGDDADQWLIHLMTP